MIRMNQQEAYSPRQPTWSPYARPIVNGYHPAPGPETVRSAAMVRPEQYHTVDHIIVRVDDGVSTVYRMASFAYHNLLMQHLFRMCSAKFFRLPYRENFVHVDIRGAPPTAIRHFHNFCAIFSVNCGNYTTSDLNFQIDRYHATGFIPPDPRFISLAMDPRTNAARQAAVQPPAPSPAPPQRAPDITSVGVGQPTPAPVTAMEIQGQKWFHQRKSSKPPPPPNKPHGPRLPPSRVEEATDQLVQLRARSPEPVSSPILASALTAGRMERKIEQVKREPSPRPPPSPKMDPKVVLNPILQPPARSPPKKFLNALRLVRKDKVAALTKPKPRGVITRSKQRKMYQPKRIPPAP